MAARCCRWSPAAPGNLLLQRKDQRNRPSVPLPFIPKCEEIPVEDSRIWSEHFLSFIILFPSSKQLPLCCQEQYTFYVSGGDIILLYTTLSNYNITNFGVPHDTVLWPSLFLIYITNTTLSINFGKFVCYPYDTAILFVVKISSTQHFLAKHFFL